MLNSSETPKTPGRSNRKTAIELTTTPKHNKSLEQTSFRPRNIQKVCLTHRRINSMAETKQNNFIANNIRNTKVHRERYKTDYNQYDRMGSFEIKMNKTHNSGHLSHRQTQKQIFIKKLKSKVLNTNTPIDNCESGREYDFVLPSNRQQGLDSQRQKAKSSQSIVEIEIPGVRNKTNRSRKQTDPNMIKPRQPSLLNIAQDHSPQALRSRSKTFARDFSKIVQQNFNLKRQNSKFSSPPQPQSKTIQLNDLDSKLKLAQSLHQIQSYEKRKISPGHTAQNPLFSHPRSPTIRSKHGNIIAGLNSEQMKSQSEGSETDMDTEKYDKERQQITDDFLNQWEKMNQTKNQLYQKLRTKLVTKYPSMRKKYTKLGLQQQEPAVGSPLKAKRSTSNNLQGSQLLSSSHYLNSQPSQMNNLTHTQFRSHIVNQQQHKQKLMLRGIFKQAYKISKVQDNTSSRRKNQNIVHEDAQQTKYIRNIQKNMTFMSYVTKKQWKKGLNHKKIKGAHLFKNKETILEMERQGSPQHTILKKCLDDAIETCIRGRH